MATHVKCLLDNGSPLFPIPSKSAKNIAALLHIAQDLSPGIKYHKKQLNSIIARYHEDTTASRSQMMEYGILERDKVSVYWVV